MLNSLADLKRWFLQSGVHDLHACVGPLPISGAALGRP
jgi:hypothetical protein